MQVERIDRENGAGTIISGDEFAAILERREEPEFAEEIYGNVLMGGNYLTAGFLYQRFVPDASANDSTDREYEIGQAHACGYRD